MAFQSWQWICVAKIYNIDQLKYLEIPREQALYRITLKLIINMPELNHDLGHPSSLLLLLLFLILIFAFLLFHLWLVLCFISSLTQHFWNKRLCSFCCCWKYLQLLSELSGLYSQDYARASILYLPRSEFNKTRQAPSAFYVSTCFPNRFEAYQCFSKVNQLPFPPSQMAWNLHVYNNRLHLSVCKVLQKLQFQI